MVAGSASEIGDTEIGGGLRYITAGNEQNSVLVLDFKGSITPGQAGVSGQESFQGQAGITLNY